MNHSGKNVLLVGVALVVSVLAFYGLRHQPDPTVIPEPNVTAFQKASESTTDSAPVELTDEPKESLQEGVVD